ncbi:C1 family peptidase [Williamwhitmania taraxaci]|uniref:Aminopeptidase n=1 Tax=Williamwhitmania taraxaci TaxID=1640674 RepID=A0A1G6Q696_9BACT|nr:C1 family peptidase [Williamwhitmania taraxaci]SDC88000.1 bleomycin hydrolase [Williamwhitmania taraxaci]
MNKKLLGVLLLLVAPILLVAQQSITPDALTRIKKGYSNSDPYAKAVTNALSANDAKKLTLNRENVGKTDSYFKYKVKVKGITDQKSSGRCWMFTSLNLFRPVVIDKLKVASFEFSENYLYFYDILEKSNLFLENAIITADKPMDDRLVELYFKSPIDDGGVWSSFVNLVKKYGVVPKEVMPETNSSSNTSKVLAAITTKLREDGLALRRMVETKSSIADIRNLKMEQLSQIYRMLALNLGEPPTSFTWRYQSTDNVISPKVTYTPREFAKQMLPNLNLEDYVMFMNDPSRPYYKLYEIENYRNVVEGINWKYLNLPADELKAMALISIKSNEPLYTSCDVGKQLNSEDGLLSLNNYDMESLYGVKFGMDKKDRILSRESGSSHGMALVAVDVDDNGKTVKWQFENSWGATSGQSGYLVFTDDWFTEYVFRLVVNKKYIPENTKKLLEQKPVMLPAWDPMF